MSSDVPARPALEQPAAPSDSGDKVLELFESIGGSTTLPYDASEPLWQSRVGAPSPPRRGDLRGLPSSAHPWNASPTPLPPQRSPWWIVAAAAGVTILATSAAMALWM